MQIANQIRSKLFFIVSHFVPLFLLFLFGFLSLSLSFDPKFVEIRKEKETQKVSKRVQNLS